MKMVQESLNVTLNIWPLDSPKYWIILTLLSIRSIHLCILSSRHIHPIPDHMLFMSIAQEQQWDSSFLSFLCLFASLFVIQTI